MEAFENIYNEYFPRVYRFLSGFCSDSALCEEITQETFYRAYVNFGKYDGSCEIFTWLAAIAKNTYYNYLRKNKIKFVKLEVTEEDENGDPVEIISREYEAKRVKKAVSSLPEKYRDVVFLRIYANLSYRDIASYLGICESTAKVIFHRAKEMLKKELSK